VFRRRRRVFRHLGEFVLWCFEELLERTEEHCRRECMAFVERLAPFCGVGEDEGDRKGEEEGETGGGVKKRERETEVRGGEERDSEGKRRQTSPNLQEKKRESASV